MVHVEAYRYSFRSSISNSATVNGIVAVTITSPQQLLLLP